MTPAEIHLAIADEIVAAINAAVALGVTAERHYQPNWDIEDLQTTRVSVVPFQIKSTQLDRHRERHEHQIDIGVQKKLTETDNAATDPLVKLVGEIAALFRKKRLATTGARCSEVDHIVMFSPEHFDQYRAFTSLLRLTFSTTDA